MILVCVLDEYFKEFYARGGRICFVANFKRIYAMKLIKSVFVYGGIFYEIEFVRWAWIIFVIIGDVRFLNNVVEIFRRRRAVKLRRAELTVVICFKIIEVNLSVFRESRFVRAGLTERIAVVEPRIAR